MTSIFQKYIVYNGNLEVMDDVTRTTTDGGYEICLFCPSDNVWEWEYNGKDLFFDNIEEALTTFNNIYDKVKEIRLLVYCDGIFNRIV